MKTKIIVGCLLGVSVVGGYALMSREPTVLPPGDSSNIQTIAPQVRANTSELDVLRCAFPHDYAASYDYRANVEAAMSIQGMTAPVTQTFDAQAKLAIEVLSKQGTDTVLLAQFVLPNETLTKMHGDKFGNTFLLKVGTACDIKQFGRAKSVSLKTSQAQQIAMYDLFFKVPKETSSELTYENGVGVAKATFTSTNGVIMRTIGSYEMGWRTKNTFAVTTTGARIVLNDHWIESFESAEGISGGMVSSAKTTTSLTKEKATTAISSSASRKEADYEWTNLLSGTFAETTVDQSTANISQAEQRYVAQMKNVSMENAFGSMVERIGEKSNIEEQWHEMAGFLNGHPEKIDEFAEGLKQNDFPQEAKAVSYLALSKTAHTQARDALIELRRDTSLPKGDRVQAALSLITRKDVGVEVAREMKREALVASTGDAETDFLPRNTLLHLGVLAGLHKADEETMAEARDAIKTQLKSAGEDTYLLSPALGAAGNLGDRSLLSTITSYTQHPDYHVRQLAPKALRGYAYAETEKVFSDWLARETHPDVKEAIFDVIVHQLADAQRNAGPAIAIEAMKHIKMKPLILARQSIVHILGPLKNTNPAFKQTLMEQMAEEFRSQSGLYSQIANYLAPAEVELAHANMPEFAHQYGPAAQAQAEAKVRQLEEAERKQAANSEMTLEMP